MRFFYVLIAFTFLFKVSFAQKDTANTLTKPKTLTAPADTSSGDKSAAGVAVSPSKVIFNAKAGSSQTREVRVNNASKKTVKFQISFTDFNLGRTGKPNPTKPGENKFGLSDKIYAVPAYFELKPGQVQVIKVTLAIPDKDESNISGWSLMAIDQITERPPLSGSKDQKSVALGIIPSFGFGVYIYNNPPGVKNTNVEIEQFSLHDSLGHKTLKMVVHNVGDGIGFCAGYAELTNLKTGKITKVNGKNFTILPGFYRDFVYDIPKDQAKGSYSVVGVVDFGNETEVKAAELEFEIK